MEEQILKLEKAIDLLDFLNGQLVSIDKDCKDIINGIFSYDKYENLGFFDSIEERSSNIAKTLNFPVLYSTEDEKIKKRLDIYKKLFDENSALIESIKENYSQANFNNDNYFANVYDGIVEINAIVEIGESLGDSICANLSKKFLDEKVNPSIIDSDYILAVLCSLEEEQIQGYMNLVKIRLKEIQGASPYIESGLEIFESKKPVQEESVQVSDYNDAFKDILKNVNRFDK